MENVKLENEDLLIEIAPHGAELSRIYDKDKDQEILWEGTPSVWNRHAPILFPFVGKSYEGTYRLEGKEYAITPHGFARDFDFTLTSATDNEVWFQLKSNDQTLAVYPFPFVLEVGHKLVGRVIQVMWRVINEGSDRMYFMIGGHPAFRTPKGKTIFDYSLDFHRAAEAGPVHYQAPNADGFGEESLSGELELQDGKTPIVPGFFDRALTYIFDRGQVETISLLVDGKPYVKVSCEGFPYVGVWTMEATHPFVCLEPWFGRCDEEGWRGELKDREGVQALDMGSEFNADYTIEIM